MLRLSRTVLASQVNGACEGAPIFCFLRLPRTAGENWIKVKNRQHPAFSRVMDQFEV
jgi:hypothetical protein